MKIAIVIPAHNEADNIVACLTAITHAVEVLAAQNPRLKSTPIAVNVVVVLDSCTDHTQALVIAFAQNFSSKKSQITCQISYLTCDFRCVGKVRDFGIRHAISANLTEGGAEWLACTDADTQVCEDWLTAQLAHQPLTDCDMICGVVSVDSWQHLSAATREQYEAHYQDKMGHRHIHGANLCFSRQAYEAVGGFSPLPCHEDVDLVKKFETAQYRLVWSNQVRVITSSRLEARAEEGFAAFLKNLQHNPTA